MAAKAWFNYVSDNGVTYGVELSKELGALTGSGFTAYTAAAGKTTLPSGWKMRYVNAVQTTGTGGGFVSRRFPMGTTGSAIFSGTTGTFEYDGETYSVSSARGEKQRKPKVADTGK